MNSKVEVSDKFIIDYLNRLPKRAFSEFLCSYNKNFVSFYDPIKGVEYDANKWVVFYSGLIEVLDQYLCSDFNPNTSSFPIFVEFTNKYGLNGMSTLMIAQYYIQKHNTI